MRAYRALLHLYPASFRNEYGEEMCAVFARGDSAVRVGIADGGPCWWASRWSRKQDAFSRMAPPRAVPPLAIS
jgi:hypothetical protein